MKNTQHRTVGQLPASPVSEVCNGKDNRHAPTPAAPPAKAIVLQHVSLKTASDLTDPPHSSWRELPYVQQLREAHPEIEQLRKAMHPLAAVNEILEEGMSALMKAADKGDELAGRMLLNDAVKLVTWISDNAQHDGIMKKLAPEEWLWPIVTNLTPRVQKKEHKFLAMIKLGERSEFNVKPSARAGLRRPKSVSNEAQSVLMLARNLWFCLVANQTQLTMAKGISLRLPEVSAVDFGKN